MFEVGFQELLMIALLALIVLGPEKLPKLAAKFGHWTGRARAMARNLRTQLEQEVSYDELLKQKQAAEDALRRAQQAPMDFHQDLQKEVANTNAALFGVPPAAVSNVPTGATAQTENATISTGTTPAVAMTDATPTLTAAPADTASKPVTEPAIADLSATRSS